jgi:TATA-binding protein-associated factor Taf7
MSSIEEEDESTESDELITQIEKLPSSPLPTSQQQQQQQRPYYSPSALEWDSELSESEQEFDDNNENSKDNDEAQAANRVLQSFIQSCSRTVSLKKLFCS